MQSRQQLPWALLIAVCVGPFPARCAPGKVFSRIRFYRSETRSDIPAKPPAVMRIEPVAVPPVIDGKLGDSCWRRARPFSPFVIYRTWDKATEPREARMAFDQANLYVGVKLAKAAGYKLKALTQRNDDGHMWQDDEFELFLDPGLNYSEYYQVIVNASGNFCDYRHAYRWVTDAAAAEADVMKKIRVSDRDWVSGVEAKVETGRPSATEWTIEMRLPAKALGLPGIPLGSRWGLNLTSNNPRIKQLTNWIPGDWHNPETYGHVVFGKPRLEVSGSSFGATGQGANLFRALFKNVEAKRGKYRLSVFDPDHKDWVTGAHTSFALASGQEVLLGVTYAIAAKATNARVVAQARSDDGALLYQSQRIFEVPRPLRLNVRPYGYLGAEAVVAGEIEMRLGGLSLLYAKLQARLTEGKREIARETVSVKDAQAAFTIDPASLKPGAYRLNVDLTDKRDRKIAGAAASFSIADSPFGVRIR